MRRNVDNHVPAPYAQGDDDPARSRYIDMLLARRKSGGADALTTTNGAGTTSRVIATHPALSESSAEDAAAVALRSSTLANSPAFAESLRPLAMEAWLL